MRVLLLSFYYPPDLSAGSFRCASIVTALKTAAPGVHLDVLTTQPNRYKHSSILSPALERSDGVHIRRLSLPQHDSGMLDQARAFVSYALQSLSAVRNSEPYDVVVATSSRLMTASLGAWIARRAKAPLYLDIRDLFADTMRDVLPGWVAALAGGAIRSMEKWTFRSASAISIVSEGFAEHVRRIAPDVEQRVFTNGIDEQFLPRPLRARQSNPSEPLLLVYAGNIGEGQGLHLIIPEVARRLGKRVRFRIIGAGGRLQQLRSALGDSADNVELIPPMARAELHRHYEDADILFLHLNDYPAFCKVLPSKLFEYGATGKMILAGVAGYSAQFIRDNLADAAVFAPCDVQGMMNALERLIMSPADPDRASFRERFSRPRIAQAMARDIIQVANQHRENRL